MKLTEPKALARVAAYCSKAERCEYDVQKKLLSWELSEQEQARIISYLKREKFLNEDRFCRSFVRDKVHFNKWGKMKIVFELRKKKIPQNIIDSSLSDIEDSDLDESLTNILITKNKSIKAKTDYERRTKLIRFALGRGFSMSQIIKVLNQIFGKSEEDYDQYQ